MNKISCSVCGSSNYGLLYQIPDINLGTTTDIFNYVKCGNCGFVFQNPQLTPEELSKYYPDTYSCYQSIDRDSTKSLVNRELVNFGFRKRWNFIISEFSSGKLLDIGCATGNFLYYGINNKNWDLFGLDINNRAVEIAKSRGLKAFQGSITDHPFNNNEFDVITLWDVLEHLHNPRESLFKIKNILRDGGIIIIRIPRMDSWDYGVFHQYWHGFEAPRHLSVFSKQTITRMLEEMGLKIIRTSSEYGSYMAFVIDVRFWLLSNGKSRTRVKQIEKYLYNPIIRLILSPIFAVIGKIFRGPALTVVARKE